MSCERLKNTQHILKPALQVCAALLAWPRIWCSRYLASTTRLKRVQAAAETILWHVGGWTLADMRTFWVLVLLQLAFAQASLWLHRSGVQADATQLYFAILYLVAATLQAALARSAHSASRSTELFSSGIPSLLLAVVPCASTWVWDRHPATANESAAVREARIVAFVGLVLCGCWMIISRIANLEFGWRRRARRSLHSGVIRSANQGDVLVANRLNGARIIALKLAWACRAMQVVMLVCHVEQCKQMSVEISIASGVLAFDVLVLMILQFSGSLLFHVRSAAGLPGMAYMLFLTARLFERGCGGDARDELAGIELLQSVLQLTMAASAAILQIILVAAGVIQKRFMQTAQVDSRKESLIVTLGAGAGLLTRSTSRETIQVPKVPLPAEFVGIPEDTQSKIRTVMEGHEMLLYVPFRRFSQRRFVQVDVWLNTMRWSRNESIGFDQIDDIYVAAIQNTSSQPESEADASVESACAERATFCRATSLRGSSTTSSVRGSYAEDEPDGAPSGLGSASKASASKAVVIEYRSSDPRSSGKRVQLSIFAPRCVVRAFTSLFLPHATPCAPLSPPSAISLVVHRHGAWSPLCASIAVINFAALGALLCGPSCCI